jgi:ribonuclease HI
VFSTEQSANIEAIQQEKNNKHEIVIITDSLTQTIRKMLDHQGSRITLIWVLSHVGTPGTGKTDQAAKEALDQDITTTETS